MAGKLVVGIGETFPDCCRTGCHHNPKVVNVGRGLITGRVLSFSPFVTRLLSRVPIGPLAWVVCEERLLSPESPNRTAFACLELLPFLPSILGCDRLLAVEAPRMFACGRARSSIRSSQLPTLRPTERSRRWISLCTFKATENTALVLLHDPNRTESRINQPEN